MSSASSNASQSRRGTVLSRLRFRLRARVRNAALFLGPILVRVRRLEPLVRRYLRYPHEQDFRFFARFRDDPGLFLDVGANTGLAAASFRIFQRGADILSIEPNPDHEPDLRLAKRFLDRFDYRIMGASDENANATLYVPLFRGVPITPLATLEKNQLAPWRMELLLGAGYSRSQLTIAERKIEVRRLDDLNLSPTFIKLDVEGLEYRVLTGLSETIDKQRPILLIEWSREFGQIESFLREREYGVFVFDSRTETLLPLTDETRKLNVFGIPCERVAAEPGWFATGGSPQL